MKMPAYGKRNRIKICHSDSLKAEKNLNKCMRFYKKYHEGGRSRSINY